MTGMPAVFARVSGTVAWAVLLLVAASAPVHAAPPPITWGPSQTISGDSDVSVNGTLVYAYTFGGPSAPSSATVNGVTFSPFTIPAGIITSATTGSVTLSESPGTLFGSNSFGAVSAPFANLGASYRSLLGSGGYADLPAAITVSLGGLTSGQLYEVQWWTNNSSNALSPFGIRSQARRQPPSTR